jgi:hypothetical protein
MPSIVQGGTLTDDAILTDADTHGAIGPQR